MRYTGGDPCSSGKKRSTTVELKCGTSTALESWVEPATCEYHAIVTCPEACTAQTAGADQGRGAGAGAYQSGSNTAEAGSLADVIRLPEGGNPAVTALVIARGIPAVVVVSPKNKAVAS